MSPILYVAFAGHQTMNTFSAATEVSALDPCYAGQINCSPSPLSLSRVSYCHDSPLRLPANVSDDVRPGLSRSTSLLPTETTPAQGQTRLVRKPIVGFIHYLEQSPLTTDPWGGFSDLHFREYPLRLDLFCFLSERCRVGTFQCRASFYSLLVSNWPRYVYFRNTPIASRKSQRPSAQSLLVK